uniref:Gastrin-releasing peptide n=1 Tax=Cyclopterus lumpus TaxID=8103 RepID=A0A8C2Z333_CYCLU
TRGSCPQGHLTFLRNSFLSKASVGRAAPVVGKMYPRGNHWAVGHLMGKKSIESPPEPQETHPDRDYLRPPETAGVTQRLMEALLQQKTQKQRMPQAAGRRRLRLQSGWREEDRDKYLREVSLWIISSSVMLQMLAVWK